MQYNIGHRARTRERLLSSKSGAMPDYEIMELLLCMALPRRDTKTLAKILIDKYGSFAKVISAEDESLLAIHGMGSSALACFRLIKEGAVRLTKEEFSDKPVLSSWQSLLHYCRALIGHAKKEMFLVFYLNNQKRQAMRINGLLEYQRNPGSAGNVSPWLVCGYYQLKPINLRLI